MRFASYAIISKYFIMEFIVNITQELINRSNNRCELCSSTEDLSVYEVYPSDETPDKAIYICSTCKEQMQNKSLDENYWNCLHESMWSEVPAVQVTVVRLLKKLGWQDQLDMLYLEDDVKAWADDEPKSLEVTKDANGNILNAGDSVSIIKDLEVKGAGFTAKRGTVVKNITLAPDVDGHVEGRVNGTKIYLKTEFLKKI